MSRTWSVAHVLSRVSQRGTKIGLDKDAEINFDTVLSHKLPEIGNFSLIILSSRGSPPHFLSARVTRHLTSASYVGLNIFVT